MAGSGITVDGGDQLVAALHQLADATPAMVRVLVARSGELVVDWARPKVPHRTGAAAASLQVEENGQTATVVSGGSRAPHYPWLDWGGAVGRGGHTVRPYIAQGRYLYPALRAQGDAIADAQRHALVELCRTAGLTVT